MTTTEDAYPVPHEVGERCRKIQPLLIAKKMDRNQLAAPMVEPGKCIFCGHCFEHKFIKCGDGPFSITLPVLQCERVAALWPEAREIVDGWEIKRAREQAQMRDMAKGNRKSQYEL